MANQDSYVIAVAAGSIHMANTLVARENDKDREHRKTLVLDEKRTLFREVFSECAAHSEGDIGLLLSGLDLDREQAQTLLVDLQFSDPFSPYELKTDEDDFREALRSVAEPLGVDPGFVKTIEEVREQAASAHRWRLTGRHVLMGVIGGGLFAAGGWMFAPALAGMIGGAAGLSGVAATNFGLAFLGGGSLAAGGAGMAGGMILVTGVAAGVGVVGVSGASVLHALGSQGSKQELLKLQTTYKAVLLISQKDRAKAKSVVTDLAEQLQVLEKDLRREREINDKNSVRVKELEKTIEYVENSLKWMRAEAA